MPPKSIPVEERFWNLIRKTNTCWIWLGGLRRNYGQFRVGNHKVNAHRFSWEIHYGEIPEGLVVCHKCDVPFCVNPEHLFLGTQQDNLKDMFDKGRGKVRGEESGCNLLTEKEVIDIFLSRRSHKDLAYIYDVGKSTVQCIKTGERWSWLTSQLKE